MKPGRSARAVLFAAAAAVIACDSAFQSRRGGSSGSTTFPLDLAFADGSDESTVTEGDSAALIVQLPTSGFARVVDRTSATVDPARISVSTDADLGDPAQGGFAAGTDLVAFLAALGRIGVPDPDAVPLEVSVALDSADPIPFPVGRMTWTVIVLDDIDRPSAPLRVGLTVRAIDRPTAVLAPEIPPDDTIPTGISLPLDDDGVPFAGEALPFVLSVRAFPNPQSGAGFTKLFQDGAVDPARLIVTADRDLGDPSMGGIAAGENLAALFGTDLDVLVDPATGELLIAALFALDAAFAPVLGDTLFTGVVVDDADATSVEQGAVLRVEARVTLAGDVQPIFSANCTSASCHDNTFPAAGLRLTSGNAWGETVNVRSSETPADSCATLLVDPYFFDASYLWHKVDGTHLGGCVNGSGARMPRGAPKLSGDELAAIRRWILQGAHDD